MGDDLRTIAASFDQRAARYSTVEWHRAYARRFVELASLEPGQRVLDAGAGTGFATIEIARSVGAAGKVIAVDISAGMLAQLRMAIAAANLSHVDLLQDDATHLPGLPGSTFDAVLCSSALLYMSADAALREWHRLLKPRGIVGFSTMRADSPPPGRMFRECARAFGRRTVRDRAGTRGGAAHVRVGMDVWRAVRRGRRRPVPGARPHHRDPAATNSGRAGMGPRGRATRGL